MAEKKSTETQELASLLNDADKAAESFCSDRYLSDKRGILFMLGDYYYVPAQVANGHTECSLYEGIENYHYKNGIDNFIEYALKQEGCLGLVPVTLNAHIAVTQKHKLKPVAGRVKLASGKVTAGLYR